MDEDFLMWQGALFFPTTTTEASQIIIKYKGRCVLPNGVNDDYEEDYTGGSIGPHTTFRAVAYVFRISSP